jgi:hypothetical protein
MVIARIKRSFQNHPEARAAEALEPAEVVELQHPPGGEHLDAFLGEARRAVGQVVDGAEGASAYGV